MHARAIFCTLLLAAASFIGHCAEPLHVGEQPDGTTVISTRQRLRPVGDTVRFRGRPVDLAMSPDGALVFVKDNRGLVVIDAAAWMLKQELPFIDDEGGSMHGIAVTTDGKSVYLTTAKNRMFEARANAQGTWEWTGSMIFDGPTPKEAAFPCGIAITHDATTAYVCLSRNNAVAVVDLAQHTVTRTFPTGVAPYEARLSEDKKFLYVSNWGGRRAGPGERSAPSSGTPVLVDERGVGASGTVSKFDLATQREVWTADTGLHPSSLALDGDVLFVANVNSDTISAINAETGAEIGTYSVHMAEGQPFGYLPNALAVDAAAKRLYAACAGANAIAVLDIDKPGAAPVVGLVPAGWFPGAMQLHEGKLVVANVKGLGSLTVDPRNRGHHVKQFTGTVSRIAVPEGDALDSSTKLALELARQEDAVEARELAKRAGRAVPVPKKPGQKSLIEHVFYIIRENRTYDQVFGDMPQANGDPRLCVFPRSFTPNAHALAEQFVLLDNYYCNGVVSADGHSWATEGITTDHLEKSFGGFSRSYTFGDDPLTYASSGFIWDGILAAGKSFRNFGEFDSVDLSPRRSFAEVWSQYVTDKTIPSVVHAIGVERVKQHSCPDAIGWNMDIPDQYRADVFIRELRACESSGAWPNFTIIYLPNDHTSGTDEGHPTPRAHIADNDFALGRIVEAISHSPVWPKSAIFINEDDPQDGYDHVDGHRSPCLVISPYTKRGEVISEFYNQTSVLHTIGLIMGVPPMNHMDAIATPMWDCFTKRADTTPFTALPANYPLDEVNKKRAGLTGEERHWAEASAQLDLSRPDLADEDTLNRIVWHAMKGTDSEYPAEWAGPHGRGLKALGLAFDGTSIDEDDEEEEAQAHGAGS